MRYSATFRNKPRALPTIALVLALPLSRVFAGAAEQSAANAGDARPTIVEYRDPTYGGRIRHLKKDDGHEHNLYYCRNPWNADCSRMVGIWSDLQQKNWRVVLYTGDGEFIKVLFPIAQLDWRLVWDRRDPDILYTWKADRLFRYNVKTGKAELLKAFAPLSLKPNGPSLNQAGDRILVLTSDNTFRSYRIPDMAEERAFKAALPAGGMVSWDKPSYIGFKNYIHIAYTVPNSHEQAILIYDDNGTLFSRLEGRGGGGHYTFSPDGRLAYFNLPRGVRHGGGSPLEIRTVNLDGTDDRVLVSVPPEQARRFHNLHLSWPSAVHDWFLASFFPSPAAQFSPYAPPMDEILLIHLDGSHRYLARTGTVYSRSGAKGAAGDMFWAQTLASCSSDGRRVCFNSVRAGTIDQYILYVDDETIAAKK